MSTSILSSRSGGVATPAHQRLFKPSDDLTQRSRRSSARQRFSSIMLPPETPRSRSAVNTNRTGAGGVGSRRTGSVLSQRSSLSAPGASKARRRGSSAPASSPGIGGYTYVADVHPTFCVDGSIRCAEPVNDRIAWTAEYDGTIRIRALPQGSELKQLEGRVDTYCTSLLYLAQYQKMWAAFNDGFIRIYDVASGKLLQEVVQHAGGVNCMVEMEGSVYTGGVDWKIGLWNPENSTFERLFFGHSGAVRCLCPYNGPSGSILFSGSDDGTIRAWDPYAPVQTEEDRACLHVFKGHERGVLCLEALTQLSQLWSGGEDATVRVWNLQTLEPLKVLRGHTAPVSALLPVESRMWSGDKHGHIILWDVTSLAPLQEISSRMQGAKLGMVLAMKKIQPSSCWKVWTAGSTGFVQCWNAETIPIVFDAKNQYKYGSRGVHELVQELEMYAQTLQDELTAAKEDAAMNYERGRMEMQRELMAQQLLQEENEELRQRVRELEAGAPDTVHSDVSLLKDSHTEVLGSADVSRAAAPASWRGQVPSAAIFPPGEAFRGSVTSTKHECLVKGSHWAAILSQRPHQVLDTATDEICTALGIPSSQVSRVHVEAVTRRPNAQEGGEEEEDGEGEGLLLRCEISHPTSYSSEEVRRCVTRYPFPRLCDIHDGDQGRPKGELDAAYDRILQLERTGVAGSEGLQQDVERLRDENGVLRRMLEDAAVAQEGTHSPCAAQTPSASASGVQDSGGAGNSTGPPSRRAPLAVNVSRSNLAESLETANDTIEYLKDVITEKEKQRAALSDEVQALRAGRAGYDGKDSHTSLAETATGSPGRSPHADADFRIAEMQRLLQHALRKGEAAAQNMTRLLEGIQALRGGGKERTERRLHDDADYIHSLATSHPTSSTSTAVVNDIAAVPFRPSVEAKTGPPRMHSSVLSVSSSTDPSATDSLSRRIKRNTLERAPYARHFGHKDATSTNQDAAVLDNREHQAYRVAAAPHPGGDTCALSASNNRTSTCRPHHRRTADCVDHGHDLLTLHAVLAARVRDAEAVANSLMDQIRQRGYE